MILWGNLRTCDKMADRKKKPWGMFRNKMLAKRCKTGDGGGEENWKRQHTSETRISRAETEFRSIQESSKNTLE